MRREKWRRDGKETTHIEATRKRESLRCTVRKSKRTKDAWLVGLAVSPRRFFLSFSILSARPFASVRARLLSGLSSLPRRAFAWQRREKGQRERRRDYGATRQRWFSARRTIVTPHTGKILKFSADREPSRIWALEIASPFLETTILCLTSVIYCYFIWGRDYYSNTTAGRSQVS